jgi:two-component system, NarL family, sensor kinase
MSEISLMIIASLAAITIVVAGFLFFIRHFQNTLRLNFEEKQQNQINFLNEINRTKIEIKDETLRKVANELHDNIGQILALTRIHIKSLQKKYPDEKLEELNLLTEKALNEVRSLSKLINMDAIENFNFTDSLSSLLRSIEQTNIIKSHFEIEGEYQMFNPDIEMVLFRICQEFLSNTLKHAQCENIKLILSYKIDGLHIELYDDGKGFDVQHVQKGSGLNNLYQRAQSIGAQLSLTSEKSKGTRLHVHFKN